MFECKLKTYACKTHGCLVFICCYVATGQCVLPTDEGAVKRPFIDPFVFVHLVCVGYRLRRMWVWVCGGLLSLFQFNKNTSQQQPEKKDSKKAIYFWSSATAFSEKISKAEHNIVSTDCDANKAEKQWIKPKPFDLPRPGFDQPGCSGLTVLS